MRLCYMSIWIKHHYSPLLYGQEHFDSICALAPQDVRERKGSE